MLIKEGRTLWFGRHPSAQAVWNLTAAWANGARYAFGETRHETQRRVLMSLADLSGTQDEWERWREHTEREEGAALGGRWFIFFGNFVANEGRGILRWVKLDWHAPHRLSAGSQYRDALQRDQQRARDDQHIYTIWFHTAWERQRKQGGGGDKDHSDTETIKVLVYPHLCPGPPRCVVRVYTLTRNSL